MEKLPPITRDQEKIRRKGMYSMALKMLFRDKTKKYVLLGAFIFATMLMGQQAGIFAGLLRWTTSSIRLLQVPIWVMHPKVEQMSEPKPMRDTDDDLVRSVEGVAWAYPIHFGQVQIKLANGDFKTAQMTGLDTTTFMGNPSKILEGSDKDIRLPNAVMVDNLAVKKFGLKLGDVLEINDHEARIVAIFKGQPSFMGLPDIITTFDRSLSYSPPMRKMTSYVLAAPKKGTSAITVAKRISKQTGLQALTEEEFKVMTIKWYIYNTGIPVAFGTTVILGVIVGMAVSGQTFYSFVVDHLKHFATFKIMGVSNQILGRMLVLQCFVIGFLGYGIGMVLVAVFGLLSLNNSQPPFLMPVGLLLFTISMIVVICSFTCFLGWRVVKNIEAGVVFRG